MKKKPNNYLMSFLPQAVINGRYNTKNPILKLYLLLFCEQGRISKVKYEENIEVDVIVQFPTMEGGMGDLTMWIKIPR